jgi:hypothetical protein
VNVGQPLVVALLAGDTGTGALKVIDGAVGAVGGVGADGAGVGVEEPDPQPADSPADTHRAASARILIHFSPDDEESTGDSTVDSRQCFIETVTYMILSQFIIEHAERSDKRSPRNSEERSRLYRLDQLRKSSRTAILAEVR